MWGFKSRFASIYSGRVSLYKSLADSSYIGLFLYIIFTPVILHIIFQTTHEISALTFVGITINPSASRNAYSSCNPFSAAKIVTSILLSLILFPSIIL